jgi:hypothetical protein
MATISRCDACGTFMFTFGTCPKCGARKRSMTASQSVRLGLAVLGAMAAGMFALLFLLFGLSAVFRIVQSLLF